MNNYSIDFGETKVIWCGETPFVVPRRFQLEQEKYLRASQLTAFADYKSVDYILKKYFKEFEAKAEAAKLDYGKTTYGKIDNLVSDTLAEIGSLQKNVFASIDKFDWSRPTESELVCAWVFRRLEASINASRYLTRFGYYFETYAIQRQILEQLAFAYHVANSKTYTDYNDPSKGIYELKQFHADVGPFYGLLCKRTHIDKTQIKLYVSESGKNLTNIMLASIENSLETIKDLIKLIDIYSCTYEYCFKGFLRDYKFVHTTNDHKVRNKRPFIFLEGKFRQKSLKVISNAK